MTTTSVRVHLEAPPSRVYAALLDADAVARWRAPHGMTCFVHAFEPWEGGAFRVSLTYDAPTGAGKTSARTDTYHGRFASLVPDERVVEILEFETTDPSMTGEMAITTTLEEVHGGTDLLTVHEGLPSGIAPADNEQGTREALRRLARLLDADPALVELSIDIAAPPEAIWRALTTPDETGQWMRDFRMESSWRVGEPIALRGRLHGKPYAETGTILAAEPGRLARFEHWSRLWRIPDLPGNRAVLELRVERAGEVTRLSLRHELPDVVAIAPHSRFFWTVAFDLLKEWLEGTPGIKPSTG